MKKIVKILIAPIGIVIFVVAIMLLSHEIKNCSYQEILSALKSIPSIKIIIALALTLLYYLILGGYDVIAFKYINVPLKFKNVVFTCFISNALGNNTGFSMLFGVRNNMVWIAYYRCTGLYFLSRRVYRQQIFL